MVVGSGWWVVGTDTWLVLVVTAMDPTGPLSDTRLAGFHPCHWIQQRRAGSSIAREGPYRCRHGGLRWALVGDGGAYGRKGPLSPCSDRYYCDLVSWGISISIPSQNYCRGVLSRVHCAFSLDLFKGSVES